MPAAPSATPTKPQPTSCPRCGTSGDTNWYWTAARSWWRCRACFLAAQRARRRARALGQDADQDEVDELQAEDDAPEVQAPPPPELPVADLIRQRRERWAQRRAHEEARALVPIRFRAADPVGILIYGDPHVDDEGTDLGLLLDLAQLVARTSGMYAATVGDVQNNWVGRLQRLYANQSTTAREGWLIAEEWIRQHAGRWLWIVLGNHDLWTGPADPMRWIAQEHGVGALAEWSVRLSLQFPAPRGAAPVEVRINCAHDFPGSSQWNGAHGPAKALRMGVRDHVAICGHRHHMAYQPIQDPDTGGLLHAVRVGSAKRYDEHARMLGHGSGGAPAVLLTIDPRAPEASPDRIKLHWDPHSGADYLTWLRSRS